MSAVRLAAVDGADRHYGWQPGIDTRLAVLESPVGALLDHHRESLAAADRVALVPDAQYPFHPSTGMVTDPAVIGAIATWVDREIGADLAVVGRTDDRIAFRRTVEYLGYEGLLERFDADLVDVADDDIPHSNEYGAVDGRSVPLSVPDPLRESTVIVVPTLRPTADGPLAGGLRTLAPLVSRSADPTLAAVAGTRAVDPALAVLDGAVAYGSDPVATNVLAAGPVPAVDAVGSSLLGRTADEDDVIAGFPAGSETAVTIENPDDLDLSSVRDRLADGRLPPADDTHPAVAAAYRLYATVSGDVVPPQLEGR